MNYRIIDIGDDLPLYADQIMKIEKISFPSPWTLGAFETERKNDVSNLWAVVTGSELTGYICFWMFDTECHIINFAIHPKMRGRGLGEYLLASTISKAVDNRLNFIWLEVRPSNLAAIALYTKFSFTETGRRPGYYNETNEDAILMSLDLTEKRNCFDVNNIKLPV